MLNRLLTIVIYSLATFFGSWYFWANITTTRDPGKIFHPILAYIGLLAAIYTIVNTLLKVFFTPKSIRHPLKYKIYSKIFNLENFAIFTFSIITIFFIFLYSRPIEQLAQLSSILKFDIIPWLLYNSIIWFILLTTIIVYKNVETYIKNKRLEILRAVVSRLRMCDFPACLEDRADYYEMLDLVLSKIIELANSGLLGMAKAALEKFSLKSHDKIAWILFPNNEQKKFSIVYNFSPSPDETIIYKNVFKYYKPSFFDESLWNKTVEWWRDLSNKEKKDNLQKYAEKRFESGSACGYIFHNARSVKAKLVHNLDKCDLFEHEYTSFLDEEFKKSHKFKSMVSSVLIRNSENIGVLMLLSRQKFGFIQSIDRSINILINLLNIIISCGIKKGHYV